MPASLMRALEESEPDIARLIARRHVLHTMEQLRKAFFVWGAKMFDF